MGILRCLVSSPLQAGFPPPSRRMSQPPFWERPLRAAWQVLLRFPKPAVNGRPKTRQESGKPPEGASHNRRPRVRIILRDSAATHAIECPDSRRRPQGRRSPHDRNEPGESLMIETLEATTCPHAVRIRADDVAPGRLACDVRYPSTGSEQPAYSSKPPLAARRL